jgi:PAS domain-containing protein
MSSSVTQFPAAETDLIANIFDELPLPAFVLDHDFNIVDFNFAGARLLDRVPCATLRLRGRRLQCIHSIETGDDAATFPCQECLVKNFFRKVINESRAGRKTGRLRLTTGGKASDVDFLITITPLQAGAEQLDLLILDDATELSAVLQSSGLPPNPASSSPDSKAPAKAPGRKTGSS